MENSSEFNDAIGAGTFTAITSSVLVWFNGHEWHYLRKEREKYEEEIQLYERRRRDLLQIIEKKREHDKERREALQGTVQETERT